MALLGGQIVKLFHSGKHNVLIPTGQKILELGTYKLNVPGRKSILVSVESQQKVSGEKSTPQRDGTTLAQMLGDIPVSAISVEFIGGIGKDDSDITAMFKGRPQNKGDEAVQNDRKQSATASATRETQSGGKGGITPWQNGIQGLPSISEYYFSISFLEYTHSAQFPFKQRKIAKLYPVSNI